jgi:hypothetical protein
VQTWEYLGMDVDVRHDNPYGWSDSTGRSGGLSSGGFSGAVCNELGA